MKKVEAVIKRASFSDIGSELQRLGYFIIDKRNLEDSKILDTQKGSRVGSTGIRSIPLAKIELVVEDKDARKVVGIISKRSGLSSKPEGKIFISEMAEVVDMGTLEGKKDLEIESVTIKSKVRVPRSRLVPLQKHTLLRVHKVYIENKETLETDYRIKSFSDFVNHCIMGYLPTLEKQLKNSVIHYENNFGRI